MDQEEQEFPLLIWNLKRMLMGFHFMKMLMSDPNHCGRGTEVFWIIGPVVDNAVRVKAERRNAAEEGRPPVQVQSAGRYSKGMDFLRNLCREDLSEKKVIIFKLCRKFNIPHIASNEPGQVPHEYMSITKTIVTRSVTSALTRKRRSQSAGGQVPVESSSSSDSARPASKKQKAQKQWEGWVHEYKKRQSDHLDDLSLPKLETLRPLGEVQSRRKGCRREHFFIQSCCHWKTAQAGKKDAIATNCQTSRSFAACSRH